MPHCVHRHLPSCHHIHTAIAYTWRVVSFTYWLTYIAYTYNTVTEQQFKLIEQRGRRLSECDRNNSSVRFESISGEFL